MRLKRFLKLLNSSEKRESGQRTTSERDHFSCPKQKNAYIMKRFGSARSLSASVPSVKVAYHSFDGV